MFFLKSPLRHLSWSHVGRDEVPKDGWRLVQFIAKESISPKVIVSVGGVLEKYLLMIGG